MDLKNKLNLGHMGNKCIYILFTSCVHITCVVCVFLCVSIHGNGMKSSSRRFDMFCYDGLILHNLISI